MSSIKLTSDADEVGHKPGDEVDGGGAAGVAEPPSLRLPGVPRGVHHSVQQLPPSFFIVSSHDSESLKKF